MWSSSIAARSRSGKHAPAPTRRAAARSRPHSARSELASRGMRRLACRRRSRAGRARRSPSRGARRRPSSRAGRSRRSRLGRPGLSSPSKSTKRTSRRAARARVDRRSARASSTHHGDARRAVVGPDEARERPSCRSARRPRSPGCVPGSVPTTLRSPGSPATASKRPRGSSAPGARRAGATRPSPRDGARRDLLAQEAPGPGAVEARGRRARRRDGRGRAGGRRRVGGIGATRQREALGPPHDEPDAEGDLDRQDDDQRPHGDVRRALPARRGCPRGHPVKDGRRRLKAIGQTPTTWEMASRLSPPVRVLLWAPCPGSRSSACSGPRRSAEPPSRPG